MDDAARWSAWLELAEGLDWGMPAVAEIHEMMQKGGAETGSRTADQTAAAIFWTANGIAPWRAAAHSAIATLPRRKAERVLPAFERAMAEAQAAAHWLEGRYPSPRPRAVITGAVRSRLEARSYRADWRPLVERHVDAWLPCESCLAGGAAAGALRVLTGVDALEVSVTCPPLGLAREFRTLSAMLQESEDACVWSGRHFRSAAVESTELGLRIGERVAKLR